MMAEELQINAAEADDEAPAPAPEALSDEPSLIIDVDGFEGPLDLLLTLARQQKVDLARISILALAEQYLGFIEQARSQHLELAADYLVMAAWLAYLKSRLLIPQVAGGEEPSAADLAASLALRLQRLEAIRTAAAALTARPQLGREVFSRGAPEPVNAIKHPEWSATLYDLLSVYAASRRKTTHTPVRFKPRMVWSLAEARAALERLVGLGPNNTSWGQDWGRLDDFLLGYVVEPAMRATAFASSFAATLEMIREGVIEVHQDGAFAPIYLRKRSHLTPVTNDMDGPTPEPPGAPAGPEPQQ